MKKAILFALLNFIVFFAFSQQNSEENQIDAIFIGTDATENWNKDEFMVYAKPHFDSGRAWKFTTLTRNIFSKKEHAWFDELLETQIGICRGSGVLKKPVENGKSHTMYFLSVSLTIMLKKLPT